MISVILPLTANLAVLVVDDNVAVVNFVNDVSVIAPMAFLLIEPPAFILILPVAFRLILPPIPKPFAETFTLPPFTSILQLDPIPTSIL